MSKHQDRFTADHALDISKGRHEAFEKTMNIIRNMIDSQIRDAAKMGKQSVAIEIPRTVFGRETFDIIEMGRALADQLWEDKFTVTGTYTRFNISWGDKKKPGQSKDTQISRIPSPTKAKPLISLPTPRKRS